MSMSRFYLGDLSGYVHFLLYRYASDIRERQALAFGFLARSKTTVTALAQSLGTSLPVKISGWKYETRKDGSDDALHWESSMKFIDCGRDHFTYCLSFSPEIGDGAILTSRECECGDLYDYLMIKFKLPLLREWMPAIMERLKRELLIKECGVGSIACGSFVKVPIHGVPVMVRDLKCYDTRLITEEGLEQIVSDMVGKGVIRFTDKPQKPLEFDGLDGYFTRYGQVAIKNLHKSLKPLTELKSNVENLALKNKSLFPQQAATVEGIVAMEAAGKKYAVVNHGMGCGKTIEAASSCEAIAVGKWLKSHPGKTLKDAYVSDGIINYRAIVMAPSHLVEKWGQEVREEIPYAKVTVIRSLDQLCELKSQGRKPKNGKEFFIISKDKAKLGTQLSPTPVKIGRKPLSLGICADCADEDGRIVFKAGAGRDSFCPKCHGTRIRPVPQPAYGTFKGLICPYCGELLLRFGGISPDSETFKGDPGAYVLRAKSFAKPNKSNSQCYHCGESLWGANAKPLMLPGQEMKKQKWRKVSHYANFTKKSKESGFVLKGHEEEYLQGKVTDGMSYAPTTYGPRKIAPSWYVKKHLKGYFDFCILDEAHKYLGESAQAVSAHALIKASHFTMALTGTISNGTASCFYNLFFMLEPSRLIKMGYGYGAGDRQRFCEDYGCVEREYELSDGGVRNSMSRGKALGSPKVKPGISPVLFGALLMDCSLFMDISDLSRYLPKLRETVRVVTAPEHVMYEYSRVIDALSQASKRGGLGRAILGQQLQFGLNYPDKPYGRGPIMNPFIENSIVCSVNNFLEYSGEALLPKEEALVDIINEELAEGRNSFVYATATNSAESCVTDRLKNVIERYCNLKGRVEIIQSTSPAACDREAWFHKRASEGIRVFICNPKCVETGLDFCFKHNGVAYNYPTLVFYQTSYELATIWQASRRAYRLSQKEECRNYYLAYDRTLQVAALQIMARKQVATAAIQGHFSAEGLASMAQGVDARTLLAQALSENDMGSSDGLADMFDVLAKNAEEADDGFGAFVPSKSFYELVGRSEQAEVSGDGFDVLSLFSEFGDSTVPFAETPVVATVAVTEELPASADAAADVAALLGMDISDALQPKASAVDPSEDLAALLGVDLVVEANKTAGKKKKAVEGQISLLDLFAI